MNTIGTKLAAVALSVCTFATPSFAGKGGSAAAIQQAVQSGSVDAIRAEVERAEGLICEQCIDQMIALTQDSRYEVREVAAWWFAKRPVLKDSVVVQMNDALATGDSVHVRNAADFVGRIREYKSLPQLRIAWSRGVSADARLAIVRALGFMAHTSGNAILQSAMQDADAGVRAAAVVAWRDVLQQASAAPVVPLLADSDARVRSEAATVVGAYREATARGALEQLVLNDADATVRRNAAWALGRIGAADSRAALSLASHDASALVRGVAAAALVQLR
jgi:HEAT repeat protein